MNIDNESVMMGLPEAMSQFDLNLLVAFDALARELSVTRAADRVGVTQSAMSHTLRRLRATLDDPLLIRAGGGMVLTPRAEALVDPVRAGLVTLGRALGHTRSFEPATARRQFRMVAPDLFDALALPPLLERIRREAPGVDLSAMSHQPRLAHALETGEIDVAITALLLAADGTWPTLNAPGLQRRTLFHDGMLCYLRADHPALADGPLTPERFAAMSHALVSPTGAGPGLVDRALAAHGLRRRVVLRLPTFYPAPMIIADSDLVLTAPTSMLALLPEGSPLIGIEPPVELPKHGVALVWHKRFTGDPGNQWLRERIVEITAPA